MLPPTGALPTRFTLPVERVPSQGEVRSLAGDDTRLLPALRHKCEWYGKL